ncbi:hypothetical protein [Anabaena catenula]|uniref:Uncharacterized protein n=1 Tax=Anabaena catenula FACHB-362 TaxID=2692877 RepID=A0ABR8JAI8_9NOST|nr:hypothetical protein [Anabaena catenula]MBD2694444.1 hypothetical protein [Anabaena catenula FACHB-362]
MSKIHLPEDVGDLPSKLGVKPLTGSFSTAISEQTAAPTFRVQAPQAGDTEVVVADISEITQDVFALKRKVKAEMLFRNTSRYDIEPSQWGYVASDTAGGGLGEQSVIWTNRNNVRAVYPGNETSILFSPDNSAIVCECKPFLPETGVQQALLFSKRVFAPSVAAPIFITVAVKMSISSSIYVIKEWGWFSGIAGYFFRIKADGGGDNFSIVRRYKFGGEVIEQEIPRSQFNSDKLDGTGPSRHTQNFTNVGMYGIEVGSGCGYSTRFWAYIMEEWVVIHSLDTVAGGSQLPAIDEQALPLTFLITNSRQTATRETLFKYGTSVTSIGQYAGETSPNEVSSTKKVTTARTSVLLGIRSKSFIGDVINSTTTLPVRLQGVSGRRMSLFLLRNPELDPSLSWTSLGDVSGTEYNLSRVLPFTGGQVLARVDLPSGQGGAFNLNDIFSLQRTFSTTRYSNDAQIPGDSGQQFPVSQDEIWLCASFNEFTSGMAEESLPWDTSSALKTTVSSNGSVNNFITYKNSVLINVSASLIILEI